MEARAHNIFASKPPKASHPIQRKATGLVMVFEVPVVQPCHPDHVHVFSLVAPATRACHRSDSQGLCLQVCTCWPSTLAAHSLTFPVAAQPSPLARGLHWPQHLSFRTPPGSVALLLSPAVFPSLFLAPFSVLHSCLS